MGGMICLAIISVAGALTVALSMNGLDSVWIWPTAVLVFGVIIGKRMVKNKRAVSEMMGVIILMGIILLAGSMVYLTYSVQLGGAGAGFGSELDKATRRAGGLLSLLWYEKGSGNTRLYIYHYGIYSVEISRVTTVDHVYNASQVILQDSTGENISLFEPGELSVLIIPESTTSVSLVSRDGGVWTWQTP